MTQFRAHNGSINKITNVLYVPKIIKNPLSIGVIGDKGHLFPFGFTKCLIIEKKSKCDNYKKNER
jgi:hypothetical protein